VDGTGSGSCPVADFGISGVEHPGPVITVLISYGLSVLLQHLLVICSLHTTIENYMTNTVRSKPLERSCSQGHQNEVCETSQCVRSPFV